MKQKIKYPCSITILLLVASNSLVAQNMNTPYSIYGVGDIDNKAYNRTTGMAGTGLALRSSYYLVDNNPAGLTGLTRSFFVISAAATGKVVKYSGDPIPADNSSNNDFWIKRLSVAVKLNDHWASSIGLGQFSTVNYNFFGSKTAVGSTDVYPVYYEGDGGLNEYYWSNAFSIGKHFSVGLKSSILAGSINQTETIAAEGLGSAIATKVQDYFGKPRFEMGGMYYTPVTKKWDLSVGGKFIPSVKMISERTLTVTEGSTPLMNEEFIKNDRFSLPNTYAVGIALKRNNRVTYAVDYTYDDWTSLKIKEQGWQLVSSSKISAGVDFSKQVMAWNQLVEKRSFQLGVFYSNSYLQIRNEPVKEYGFSAGTSGALSQNLIYTASLEAGSRGTTQQKLIRENYIQLSVSLSYRDFLRSKGRKYD